MNYMNIPGYSDLQLSSTLLPIPQIVSEIRDLSSETNVSSDNTWFRSFEERAMPGETAQNSTSYYRQFSRAGVLSFFVL